MTSSILNAQYVPKFKMNYDGAFTTQDGRTFDVAVVDDKNATELFDIVRKHVALTYNSPKEAESNVEDKIIAIYSYAKNCTFYTAPGMKFYLSFHYSLNSNLKMAKLESMLPYYVIWRVLPGKLYKKRLKQKASLARMGY